ncbi:hypothetical protein M565_ctg1P1928 [Vibrio cyclitrophicus FF75]|nr:hypothetical protein M565_ctg1P1928 [Vibrio cyclitrophicus FF75]
MNLLKNCQWLKDIFYFNSSAEGSYLRPLAEARVLALG